MTDSTFLNSHPIIVYINDGEKIIDVNERALDFFSYSRDEFLSMKLSEIGEWVQTSKLQLDLSEEQKRVLGNRIWLCKCKNHKKYYSKLTQNRVELDGRIVKVAIVHDMTDFVLENQPATSRSIEMVGSPLAEIEWRNQRELIQWNERAENLFGYSYAEIKDTVDFSDKVLYPGDSEIVQQAFDSAVERRQKSVDIINRNVTKDGSIIYCEWHNSIIYDKNGEVISVHSLVNDITDRVESQKRIQEVSNSFVDLFNAVSDAIYIQNLDGTILEINKGVEQLFGHEREDIIGRSTQFLEAPGKMDYEWYEDVLNKAKDNHPQKVELWYIRKNGEVFPADVSISRGTYFGEETLIHVARDISDRYTSEELLKHRNELFFKLFDSSPLGIAVLNKHKEVEMVNKGFETMFDYTMDEIYGLELDRVIVQEELFDEAKQLTHSTFNVETVTKRRRKDGSLIDVIIYGIPVVIEGKVAAIYGIYVDISAQKKAEEKVEQSLKEKEVLLAEIHHRVKNNLAVITGLLELQMNSVNEDDEAWDILKESQLRIHSIALVHEKLYQSEDLSEISFDVYIKELLQVMERSIQKRDKTVKIVSDIDPITLTVNQAIPCGLWLNEIVTNAYKHAFEGRDEGTVKVAFKDLGDELCFLVSDDGVGLPDNVEELMKKSLGMRLIRTLSKQLNGTLTTENDQGSKFELLFKKDR